MKIQFDQPPGSAQENNGLSVRYAAAKRKVPRWRWYLLLAMVLTPPAYLLTRFLVAYRWGATPAGWRGRTPSRNAAAWATGTACATENQSW